MNVIIIYIFMELFSFILDITLMIIGVFVAWKVVVIMRSQTENDIGLLIIGSGIVLIGFIHLIETFMFLFFNISLDLNEFIHRLLNLFAFLLLAFGFYMLQRETSAKTDKQEQK